MAYRHCKKCGWGYDREEWTEAAFCANCGAALRPKPKAKARPPRVEHIEPYPDRVPGPRPGSKLLEYATALRGFAVEHPYLFSVGAIGAGVGAIMLAPYLVTIGQAGVAIGAVLIAAGMLGSVYAGKEDGTRLISAGFLVLLAGIGVVLVGYVLTTAGVVAVVTGGVGSTALAKEVLRRRLLKKVEETLKEKSIPELLEMSKAKGIG